MQGLAYLASKVNPTALELAIHHVPVIEELVPGVVPASSPVWSKYTRWD